MPDDALHPARQKAFSAALRILTGRDHSAAELERKLLRRGFDAAAVGSAIAECRRLDYLNDARTARQIVSRAGRKGWSMLRLRAELSRKGLSAGDVEGVVEEAFGPEAERQRARRVLESKLKFLPAEPDRHRHRLRVQRLLRYRGFSDQVILDMLEEAERGRNGSACDG